MSNDAGSIYEKYRQVPSTAMLCCALNAGTDAGRTRAMLMGTATVRAKSGAVLYAPGYPLCNTVNGRDGDWLRAQVNRSGPEYYRNASRGGSCLKNGKKERCKNRRLKKARDCRNSDA
jgi:hypothetical protein